MSYDAEVLADSPTIYLKLDETSGTVCADSSGNSNAFTYQAGVTLARTGLVADGGTSVSGSGTAAAALLGSVPAALSNPTAFTLECWVNLTSSSQNGCFVKVGGSNSTGYAFGVGASSMDTVGNDLVGIAETLAWKPSGKAIGTGAHHVAMARDAAGWYFYIDGTLKATLSAQAINAATADVSVAGYTNSGSNRFLPSTDSVDCVAIYTSALSAARILAHYNAGLPPSTARAFREPGPLRRQAIIRAAHY